MMAKYALADSHATMRRWKTMALGALVMCGVAIIAVGKAEPKAAHQAIKPTFTMRSLTPLLTLAARRLSISTDPTNARVGGASGVVQRQLQSCGA